MQDNKSPVSALYMMRHYLTKNITDPLSDDSRGYSDYEQRFSGSGAAGQINYLERRLPSSGKCIVSVSGTQKTDGVDYDLSRAGMTITWTGYTPPSGTDNILVQTTSIKQWVYDDHPNLNTSHFPRITVLEMGNENAPSGIGTYASYASGPGEWITKRLAIIVRHKRNPNSYVYGGVYYKNYDLVMAVSEAIENFINTNRVPRLWKFFDWKIVRSVRVFTEEEYWDVMRRDLFVDVKYLRGDNYA